MRSRHNFTTETRSTRRFTEQQSRNQKTSPRRRGERGGRPWERTLPACPAFLTPRTQDACAPRRSAQKSFPKSKGFSVSSTEQPSRDPKLGDSSRLRAFVVKLAPKSTTKTRRRELSRKGLLLVEDL